MCVRERDSAYVHSVSKRIVDISKFSKEDSTFRIIVTIELK